MEDTVRKYRLRWAGHVRGMDHPFISHRVSSIMDGKVGKKSAGKPKKNWVDCLEAACARANKPYGSWT
jgi:hypothetical protein